MRQPCQLKWADALLRREAFLAWEAPSKQTFRSCRNKFTNNKPRNQTMLCVNCQSEINGCPPVCPYCHTQPLVPGSQPYSGVANSGDGDHGQWKGCIRGPFLANLWRRSKIKWIEANGIKVVRCPCGRMQNETNITCSDCKETL